MAEAESSISASRSRSCRTESEMSSDFNADEESALLNSSAVADEPSLRQNYVQSDRRPSHIRAARYHQWQQINERRVDDIVLEFFYTPHTLSLLLAVIVFLIYVALFSDDSETELNIWTAIKSIFLLFCMISLLIFPNGPFTRPHPAVWRVVCGISVFYFLLLVFTLYQNFKDLKAALRWLDPDRLHKWEYEEKEYAVNCSNVTVARVWEHMDVFAFGHFWGWGMKALLLRHNVILWYLSVTWELTEIAFSHILPNFMECWWDAIILDVLVCNGLGIWAGMFVCRKLDMISFHWESIKHIRGTRGKLKRAVLQFTPASWTHMRWLDPHSSYMRVLSVALLVIVWQVTELNTFFLKHIFAIDTDHPLVVGRILLIGAAGAPTIRQYYEFVTNPTCNRLGTQCWVFVAIVVAETLVCIRFGTPLFAQAEIINMCLWFALLFFGSIGCLYCSVWFAQWSGSALTQQVRDVDGQVAHQYVESSAENLNAMQDDTRLRHRRLPNSESSVNE